MEEMISGLPLVPGLGGNGWEWVRLETVAFYIQPFCAILFSIHVFV